MKNIYLLFLLMVVTVTGSQIPGKIIREAEAARIAENWIQLIIDKNGNWGGNTSATVHSIEEFSHGNRVIGYFCRVEPSGYIIVSLRRELAPVKVYSDRSDLDPRSEKGMAGLIKGRMKGIINTIESKLGSVNTVSAESISGLTSVNFSRIWETIETYQAGDSDKEIQPADAYQQGTFLLSSTWHQDAPYNNDCPDLGCTTTDNGMAPVGCVATASAQIMKYWSWPPNGAMETPFLDDYDWVNMKDDVTTVSPAEEQAAVAELCSEVGEAVEMQYGCEGSGASTSEMASVFGFNFRYHPLCNVQYYRIDYTDAEWWQMIKDQINQNRPILYRITGDLGGHAIVCDGYQEPLLQAWQYHMNYGWDNWHTTWYTFDELFISDQDSEYVVKDIYPSPAIGTTLATIYFPTSYGYRYFDRDAAGSLAELNAGQMLQALPGTTVTGTGVNTYVRIHGVTGQETKLFTDGNPSRGAAIRNGTIRMRLQGSMKVH